MDEKKTITTSSYSYFFFVYFSTLILKMQSNVQQYYPSFYTFYESYFFPGQTPVPPRSGTWILDLSHDPIWAIWLAEVRKFHQHHDRIFIYGCVLDVMELHSMGYSDNRFHNFSDADTTISGNRKQNSMGYCCPEGTCVISVYPRRHKKVLMTKIYVQCQQCSMSMSSL